jgi:hypothetical protein
VHRRIFEPKREEVIVNWRNCTMRTLRYSSQNIITVMENEVGGTYTHNAREGDETCAQNFVCKKLRERDQLGNLSLDGRIVLKWFLNRVWIGFTLLTTGTSGRLL